MTSIPVRYKLALTGAVLLIMVLGINLYQTKTSLDRDLAISEAANTYLTEQVVLLSIELADAKESIVSLESAQELLETEHDALALERQQLESTLAVEVEAHEIALGRAALYEAQKFYLAEALDWLGRWTSGRDLGNMLRYYEANTGMVPPASCEPITPERYLRWATPPRSRMYVATPEKMGWSPYTGWSVREDVVFGPEHREDPGYLGSRGYEFRYPMIAGTRFQQEIHTTINVFEHLVDPPTYHESHAVAVVDLDCGVIGFVRVSDDPESTTTVFFSIGNFDVSVKLKYDDDLERAIPVIVQAANIVIRDLTNGW